MVRRMTSETTDLNLTAALEDYLETIYQLVRKQSFARVRDIAKARDVKAGSVSPALKRLLAGPLRGPPCPHPCEGLEDPHLERKWKTTSVYELEPGQQGTVTQINAQGAIRQRLLDMGILPDVKLEVERIAPTGEPIWIKLHGTQLALRRQEAEAVLVSNR